MGLYSLKIDEDALIDIQNATDWYNEQQQGFGSRFQKEIIKQINGLKKNANSHAIYYANVHSISCPWDTYLSHLSR